MPNPPVASSPLDIVNRALQEIAGRATVTGSPPNFDGSPAGVAAGLLYYSTMYMLLRSQDWEFATRTVALTASGNTPVDGWAYEYLYPDDCLRVRQVFPATWNTNDPQPVRWQVQDDPSGSGAPQKVILSNQQNAMLRYVTSTVVETMFDAMFCEAFVRALGSELVMAIGGRPDFSKEKLGEAGQIMQSGELRDS